VSRAITLLSTGVLKAPVRDNADEHIQAGADAVIPIWICQVPNYGVIRGRIQPLRIDPRPAAPQTLGNQRKQRFGEQVVVRRTFRNLELV